MSSVFKHNSVKGIPNRHTITRIRSPAKLPCRKYDFWLVSCSFLLSRKCLCNMFCLETLDTIGSCQRPVFSLSVFQHAYNNKPLKFWDNNERKKPPFSHKLVCFQMLDFETSKSNSEVSKSKSVVNYFFLENYVTSAGTVSHNVLYYQQLPITRYTK